MMNKKAQVWVETVIYTLIALTIIGIVLGIIRPALDERKDAVAVEQDIELLNNINTYVNDVKYLGPENSIPFEIKLSRGKLIIDGQEDKVMIVIEDSLYAPSEPGLQIPQKDGSVILFTNSTKSKRYIVTLTLDYKDKLNITYQGKDEAKTFTAPLSYNLIVKNKGGEIYNIDFF